MSAETPYEMAPIKKDNLSSQETVYKWEIAWRTFILLILIHVGAVYGAYLTIFHANFFTFVTGVCFSVFTQFGVTVGAHRLWAHRCYKARLPFRIFLATLQTMSVQNTIYDWVRDHRVHHKFTESDADPHNSTRGFFFAHMGWLMIRKHKDVKEKGQTVDLSDLLEDPVVVFQMKYYTPLVLIGFLVPIFVCHYVMGESWAVSYFAYGTLRYSVMYHLTWCVNSAAHLYGDKPFNKHIGPSENNFVISFALGEGWHNYHHTFPWDYKAAEFGDRYNWSTSFINFFARIGWAYDLKTVSEDMIRKRAIRTGDGSWALAREDRDLSKYNREKKDLMRVEEDGTNVEHLWGYGDKDAKKTDFSCMKVLYEEMCRENDTIRGR